MKRAAFLWFSRWFALPGILFMIPMAPGLASTIYGIGGGGTNLIYSVDTDSLEFQTIGSLGVSQAFGGLAYDGPSDTLYMTTFPNLGTVAKLYTVDQLTGAATLVGSTGVLKLTGLAFDSTNNVLYGSTLDTGKLYTIDVDTGNATLVGSLNESDVNGLAYDSASDRLIGVDDGGSGAGNIYEINRATGATTLINSGASFGSTGGGLAFDAATNLLWYSSQGQGGENHELTIIDPTCFPQGSICQQIVLEHLPGITGLAIRPETDTTPPTAVAGPDQSIRAGEIALLDGSASFDDNTASTSLIYAWSFAALPAGSTAELLDADTSAPSFITDIADTYIVQLVVTDEAGLSSPPEEVVISSDNLAPTAVAGSDLGKV